MREMWFGITSTCSLEKVRLSRKREGDSKDAAAVRPSSGERDLVCGGGRREQRHGVPGAGSQNEASWDATAAKSSRTAPSPSPSFLSPSPFGCLGHPFGVSTAPLSICPSSVCGSELPAVGVVACRQTRCARATRDCGVNDPNQLRRRPVNR